MDWSLLFSAMWDGLFGGARQRRTLPENALQNQSRARILDTVQKEPGTTLGTLCRELGLERGTATYHLRLLERVGIVESEWTGHTRHFFPADATPEVRRGLAVLRRERSLEIVREVLAAPGIDQGSLLRQVGMKRKVFRAYVRQFKEEGLLHERWQMRHRVYEGTDKLVHLLGRMGIHAAYSGPRPPGDERGPQGPGGGV